MFCFYIVETYHSSPCFQNLWCTSKETPKPGHVTNILAINRPIAITGVLRHTMCSLNLLQLPTSFNLIYMLTTCKEVINLQNAKKWLFGLFSLTYSYSYLVSMATRCNYGNNDIITFTQNNWSLMMKSSFCQSFHINVH